MLLIHRESVKEVSHIDLPLSFLLGSSEKESRLLTTVFIPQPQGQDIDMVNVIIIVHLLISNNSPMVIFICSAE